ncbi:MAG: transposase [Proteobacteria bacterium]|nr:transposase [Pseudomonadota bacterium]
MRNECLDHRIIFGHQHLQRTVDEYAIYYNRWRPHRSFASERHVRMLGSCRHDRPGIS